MKNDYANSLAYIKEKGLLIGLLLDLKIRDLTENRRSLDDLMYFMNRWFGKESQGYQDQDIIRAISGIIGVDLTTFFDL